MQGYAIAYKFSPWRAYIVKRFIPKIDKHCWTIECVYKVLEKRRKITLLVWGMTLEKEGIEINNPNIRVVKLEDGFIRSIGLGVRLSIPISLVADPVGIYYDSSKPSLLENMLNFYEFNNNLIERAKNLRNLILEKNLTKYNIAENRWKPKTKDKKIIVVPGQVERDASIIYGSPKIKKNIELLKAVRERNPDEYIVYKPHPDVINGYREGNYPDKVLLEYCNEICKRCSTHDLINCADEVHVLTSQFGFEALLRNKKVVCYGQPFYSGWGLTEDIFPVKRRKRKRTLEELIAASLILYPIYVSIIKNVKISPEEAIEELHKLRYKKPLKLKLWTVIQYLLEPYFRFKKFIGRH